MLYSDKGCANWVKKIDKIYKTYFNLAKKVKKSETIKLSKRTSFMVLFILISTTWAGPDFFLIRKVGEGVGWFMSNNFLCQWVGEGSGDAYFR